MSKIPIDKNAKLRSSDFRGIYSSGHPKIRMLDPLNTSSTSDTSNNVEKVEEQKDQKVNTKSTCLKTYTSFIPKMSLNLEKVVEQNPRILDLREKLNEITKKQNRSVDKKTKGIINDITQQLVDEKEIDESGPYSLLFDLNTDPSTSNSETQNSSFKTIFSGSEGNLSAQITSKISVDNNADRLPNVINFDEKPLKEFEYSCEKDSNFPVRKTFGMHSRSDLCLQLKSHSHSRHLETNQSPNDNSLSRTNEENSLDDSLGILTPDQMDDICYLDNTFSPTVEGLPIFCDNNDSSKVSPDNGDTPSTEKTESNSAASTIQNDGFDSGIGPKDFDPVGIKINSDNPMVNNNVSRCDNALNESRKNSHSKILSPAKDEISGLLDEEFMPSIHSSILEPVSSVVETTVNLEIPLDCKQENRSLVNRVDQTPSPDELPLDNSEINGEISTYSQFSASTLHDSQTYSDSKLDYPKSMETSKVSNSFITSITSITSLDGYQGDGEMSRPVSRGADRSIELREDILEMDWQNVPVTRRADPMTDSDFFTESDADGLDDNIQRGDRKAQVIDGALYGGKNGNGNLPLLVNRNDDSCMESSGVYTDFENHRSSPIFLNVIDDMSPEGGTPSSTRSECSQKNGTIDKIDYFSPAINNLEEQKLNIPAEVDIGDSPKNTSKRNSMNSDKDLKTNEKCNKDEKRSFTLKKYKMPKRDVPSKLKSMLANRKSEVDNNVQNSPKIVKKTERRDNFIKKNSLELKSDYKNKSFKDIKSKVDCSFSLQRSQTACSVTRMLSSKSTNTNTKPKTRHMRMRMELGSANGSGKSSLHSSQSDISASSALHTKHPNGRFPLLLRNGKKRESGAPTAAPSRPAAATPPTPAQPSPPVKKNGVVQKLASSPVVVRNRTSLAPPPSPKKSTLHRNAQRPNTLPTNKEPPRVTAAVGPRTKRVTTPQQTRTPPAPLVAPLEIAPREQSKALAHAAKGVEALGVLVQYLVFQLNAFDGGTWKLEAEKWRSVAATERSNAATAQKRADKDLDTIAECVSKISELEREVSSKEEINARLQATHLEEVAEMANDIKGLKETIESLKREVAESRTRLHAHSEIERTLRAQLEAARAELDHVRALRMPASVPADTADESCNKMCDKSYEMCDAACDPVYYEEEDCDLRLAINKELSSDASELAAEVRSLRAVVELKQAEIACLRDARSELAVERERRVAAERDAGAARHAAEELRERAAARQRDIDRLKDDNRRLRETAARDRDHAARMAALNEELRYKLRQRSQVMSILTGGGYVERAGVRVRSSSGSSCRSPSPDSPSPASPAEPSSPTTPPLPAVKAVVEKHDSVSWVLEIEETPEEVASRLARKSSFRTSSSPSGVKRRGGGSPGGGSPAPASPAPNASKLFRGDLDFPPPPPPLKESAGEAIYIYDDRHY